MAIVEVSIVPIGVPGTSLSDYIAKAVAAVQRSSLNYELTAMGTIISGDLDDIWEVLKQIHQSSFDLEAQRVLTQIRIDDRRDKPSSPDQKIQSVMQKL